MSNLPPLRPPPRLGSPTENRSHSSMSQTSMRSESSMSNASNESNAQASQAQYMNKRSPYLPQYESRPSTAGGNASNQGQCAFQTIRAQQNPRGSMDGALRTNSPGLLLQQVSNPRLRQHSQGYFEPSLPHTAANVSGMSAAQSAAQIAALAAMPPPGQERKRSVPGLAPIMTNGPANSRRPSGSPSPSIPSPGQTAHQNATIANNKLTATTAANVVFPTSRANAQSPTILQQPLGFFPASDKETKAKTSMKSIFRPAKMTFNKEKEMKTAPSFPSPSKANSTANLLRLANPSVTSLVDPSAGTSSLYNSSANASTSTLVPTVAEKDKEKKHHFLSRQKHKTKDEPAALPLSSAHSNSQATNPDHPQPLYNFQPDSPGPSSFAKNFDIRHGGRLLGKAKKDEKTTNAGKADAQPSSSLPGASSMEQHFGSINFDHMGPPSSSTSLFSFPSDNLTAQSFSTIGAQMGLPGIGPDDAWPLLKARLLNLFSGESLRPPIEDFNALVSVHVRRCIQRRAPIVLIEDIRELLQTGFSSLAQTLRGTPDERLITNLVEMWVGVYGTILPFLQAVFLPLELEFKGKGNLMTTREAQEFWGAVPESLKSDERSISSSELRRAPNLAEELEIRRLTLIAFRDSVILPKHESLMNIFSRLSLDNINAATSPALGTRGRDHARSDLSGSGADRPDTAGSLSPRLSSFNSQSSNFLDAASNSSGNAMSLENRSRATSNTSAGSFGTSLPHLSSPLAAPFGSAGVTSQPHIPPPPAPVFADPAKITETVAKMLQCLYVLASCQTADVAQGNVERLTGALKYNWLGRGRTGRDRRGWVGMKAGQRVGLVGAT